MAQYYQPPVSLPAFCTSQYSPLHQERLYLLQALADEEERDKRLTKALEALKSKLETNETADPPASAKKLKQAIKSIRNKIGKCQYRERALATNLANVVAEMEGMKRCQWRSAHQKYRQQSQYGQMMIMFPAVPSFTMQSSLTADMTAQMQYMALSPPRHPNLYLPPGSYNSYLVGAPPQVPQPPILHPATTYASSMGYNLPANTQVSQPKIRQCEADTLFTSPVSSVSPFNLVPFRTLLDKNFESSRFSSRSNGQQRPWSWPSFAGSDAGVDNGPTGEENPAAEGLGRRLSILDATSTGMRLDRLSRKGSAEHSM